MCVFTFIYGILTVIAKTAKQKPLELIRQYVEEEKLGTFEYQYP